MDVFVRHTDRLFPTCGRIEGDTSDTAPLPRTEGDLRCASRVLRSLSANRKHGRYALPMHLCVVLYNHHVSRLLQVERTPGGLRHTGRAPSVRLRHPGRRSHISIPTISPSQRHILPTPSPVPETETISMAHASAQTMSSL